MGGFLNASILPFVQWTNYDTVYDMLGEGSSVSIACVSAVDNRYVADSIGSDDQSIDGWKVSIGPSVFSFPVGISCGVNICQVANTYTEEVKVWEAAESVIVYVENKLEESAKKKAKNSNTTSKPTQTSSTPKTVPKRTNTYNRARACTNERLRWQ